MLQGNSVNIRVIRESDLDQFLDLVNDVGNSGEFLPVSLKSEVQLRKEFVDTGFISDSMAQYFIEDKNNEIVGLIWTFKSIPYYDATEVGYQIFKERFRGKGFASEAASIFIDYLFESKRMNRIELRIATENTPSEKIAKKLGFTLEGTNREAAYSLGKLHDMNTYAMLRSEWSANKRMQSNPAKLGR